MHVTLLLPGALLPREVIDALTEPLARSALASLLMRAQLVGDTETGAPAHLAWLAEHVFQAGLPLATAPYAYAALAGSPPTRGVLWHAGPIHLEPARDHIVVTSLDRPPTAEEAGQLIAAANALTSEMEARLVRVADRWFLQAERRWDLHAEPLSMAVGQPLSAALPTGADAITGRPAAWNSRMLAV